jgi:hypothetical protein
MSATETTSRKGMRGGSKPKYGEGITRQWVDAYKGGETIREIAERFGVGDFTVLRALDTGGVSRRRQGLRKATISVPTDPAVIGYVAGLLDGEGNLQFRQDRGAKTLAWKLAIYSTTPELIEWLSATIGGKARWAKRPGKPLGTWALYRARDVEILLRVLLPYLIVKRDTAETFLAMFDEAHTTISAVPNDSSPQ